MRTIHADLLTAQQSGAANPFIHLEINNINYTHRLISLTHKEEPYRDRATIVLTNSDHHFDSTTNDLRGKAFSIGYGYTTISGDRYCGDGDGSDGTPTLWVKSQSMVSMEGKLVCILDCEGGWVKLREFTFIHTSDPPYFNIPFTATDTIYELIDKLLIEAGFTLNALGSEDDGIIGDFQPIVTVNPLAYENGAYLIYNFIKMSKTYIREVESLAFEIVYPQSSDSIQETYYNDQAPYFKEYVEKSSLLVPNHIVVFCNRDPDGSWATAGYPLITGHARDSDQFTGETYDGGYEEVIEYRIAPYIGSQVDADNRAAAILSRDKAETLAGRLVLPFHDCRVELYDKVSIEDNRGT